MHYGFATIGDTTLYTHVTIELAPNNWMSFGPVVDKYSETEYEDAYPYGVRLRIEATGHYAEFQFGKLVGQLTTVRVS